MERCFMFQWGGGGGGVFFRWWASFLSGGVPHGESIGSGGEFFKKNCKMGVGPPPLWETLHVAIILFCTGLYKSVFSTTLDM